MFLTRYIINNNICIHNFTRSEPGRGFHNHPWRGISLVLSGSYIECTPEKCRIVSRFNYINQEKFIQYIYCIILLHGRYLYIQKDINHGNF